MILERVPQVLQNKALILSRDGNDIDYFAAALCALVSRRFFLWVLTFVRFTAFIGVFRTIFISFLKFYFYVMLDIRILVHMNIQRLKRLSSNERKARCKRIS